MTPSIQFLYICIFCMSNSPQILLSSWLEQLNELVSKNPFYSECVALSKRVCQADDWQLIPTSFGEENDKQFLYSKQANLSVAFLNSNHTDVVKRMPWAALVYKLSIGELRDPPAAGTLLSDVRSGLFSKMRYHPYSNVDETVKIPWGFRVLQSNPYGTAPIGYNREGVWIMNDKCEFVLVGSVDSFMRYSIQCVLDGSDWFRNFYWKKHNQETVKKYKLKLIRPFDEW